MRLSPSQSRFLKVGSYDGPYCELYFPAGRFPTVVLCVEAVSIHLYDQ